MTSVHRRTYARSAAHKDITSVHDIDDKGHMEPGNLGGSPYVCALQFLKLMLCEPDRFQIISVNEMRLLSNEPVVCIWYSTNEE